MQLLFFILGIIFQFIISCIYIHVHNKQLIQGIITIDHKTNLCKFSVDSNELSKRECKKVLFKVLHDGNISREKQTL